MIGGRHGAPLLGQLDHAITGHALEVLVDRNHSGLSGAGGLDLPGHFVVWGVDVVAGPRPVLVGDLDHLRQPVIALGHCQV
ncbi:hypothetical protein D3C77_741970 [compost metagenome]